VNHLTIKRRLVAADRHLMMERIEELRHRIDVDAWKRQVEEAAASLTENLNGLKTATDRFQRLRDEKLQEMRDARDEKVAEMRSLRDQKIQEMREVRDETIRHMREVRDEEIEALNKRIEELKQAVSEEMDAWKAMVHLVLESPESRLSMPPSGR
jgi:DNA anti-recombination protein RmuC